MAFLSSIVKWGQNALALANPPDATGAIPTVSAGPTGSFQIQSGNPAGYFVQLLNNSNHYATLTVQVLVRSTGGGTFTINGSNDGTADTYWTITGVSNRSGAAVLNFATASALAFPTGPVSQSWTFPVAGIQYIRFVMASAMTAGGIAYVSYSFSSAPMTQPVFFPSILNSAAAAETEPVTIVQPGNGVFGTNAALAVGMCAQTSTAGNNNTAVMLRTPAIFRSAQFTGTNAGAQLVWQPNAGKKLRLMKYCIEVPESATITSGGVVNVSFAWSPNYLGASGDTQLYPPGAPMLNHAFWAPSAAVTAQGSLYNSQWVDLGNGIFAPFATMQLYAGIQVAQSTSAVNPTWTIASNQWEAATIGFKTTNNLGLFRLVQATAAAGTATTTFSVATLPGSLVVMAVRTTNSASGAPVITVSANTAGDAYTVTTLVTNATDGANGSSLCYVYVVSSKGNAANSITVSATNAPTAMLIDYVEYQNAGGGLDAAQVGTTGNSTSPASGNYTPGTAGDLILTAYATSVSSIGPTAINSNFFIRVAAYNTSGSIGLADNFGNGALSGGMMNFNLIGTEE